MGAEAVVCPQSVPVLEVISCSPVDVKSVDEVPESTILAPSILDFVPCIRSGSFEDVGPRKCMEDEHVRIDDLSMQMGSIYRFPKPSAFYGVFDGHGGPEAAKYVKQHVKRLFFEEVGFPQASEVSEVFLAEVENCIRRAFLLADIALAEDQSISDLTGTTALTALILGRLLIVANAGDCRAVLCRKGEAIDMSRDHRPVCASERKRVEEMGGYVDKSGYLNGVLSVTRSLGDWDMKFPIGSTSPLIAEPETRQIILTEDDEFLIIGCDGIWDKISSKEAVKIVRRGLRRHNDPQRSARDLALEALGSKSFDNVTVIVVCFSALDEAMVEEQRRRPRLRCSLSTEALCSISSHMER